MKKQKIEIKKDRAITLIALVVTIIILLILAGVTIGVATNGTGLFEKAKLATDEYNNSVSKENVELEKASNEIDNYVGGNRNDVSLTMTEEQLKSLIQEEITKANTVYPEGTRITLDSGNFSNTKTITAPDDGWVILRRNNVNTRALFYLSVGELMQSGESTPGGSDTWHLGVSLPCKKGQTIAYRIYGYTTDAYLYFIPMHPTTTE